MEQLPQKLKFWNTVRKHRADFLCFLPEQNVRNSPRCLGVIFFDGVAIKVFRGVYAGMAQLLRYSDNIGAVGQKNSGYLYTPFQIILTFGPFLM